MISTSCTVPWLQYLRQSDTGIQNTWHQDIRTDSRDWNGQPVFNCLAERTHKDSIARLLFVCDLESREETATRAISPVVPR